MQSASCLTFDLSDRTLDAAFASPHGTLCSEGRCLRCALGEGSARDVVRALVHGAVCERTSVRPGTHRPHRESAFAGVLAAVLPLYGARATSDDALYAAAFLRRRETTEREEAWIVKFPYRRLPLPDHRGVARADACAAGAAFLESLAPACAGPAASKGS